MGEFLKGRADRFLETAQDLFEKNYYDLCAFNLEQAVQLYLKYAIWKILGDFEKTHRIYDLLNAYKKISNKKAEIENLIAGFEETINDLEIVYIEAKYIPAQYTSTQIVKMFTFLEKLREILDL